MRSTGAQTNCLRPCAAAVTQLKNRPKAAHCRGLCTKASEARWHFTWRIQVLRNKGLRRASGSGGRTNYCEGGSVERLLLLLRGERWNDFRKPEPVSEKLRGV